MMKIKDQIINELETIRKSRKGRLYPVDVIEFAKDKKTALHRKFTWDNTEAAHQWRLRQAAEIIRVCVVLLPNTTDPVRAYVSLSTDRGKNSGFYRATVDVMPEESLRQIMLDDAKEELETFVNKYKILEKVSDMIPIFRAIKGMKRKHKRQQGRMVA
jgi:hypothetical protein